MVENLVIAPVLVALVSLVLTMGLRRWPQIQRTISVVGVLVFAAVVGALSWRVVLAPGAPGVVAYQVAGWEAPFGITLVADGLAVFMLSMTAVVAIASIAVSVRVVDREVQRVFYHPLFHCLLLGVTGAFLAGDLFNLFVWFEVMLMATYVFIAFYGDDTHTAASFRYLVLNVIASVFFLIAVGGLYATVGTLNMADMARRLADPGAFGIDVAPVAGLSALLFAAFALKAGLVPFQFWVPGAYRAAPLPVVAMLAGATKKVGMYGIIRLYFTVFENAAVPSSIAGDTVVALLGPVLFAVGLASILIGGLGAVSQDSLDGMLAYSSIGQVGFIAVPVAIAAMAGPGPLRHLAILAALVYALHHALAKGLLFLTTATVRGATGTTRFADLGGLGGHSPLLGGVFFVGSLSLVGIPPLAGFFGKFLVFDAAARQLHSVGGAGGGVGGGVGDGNIAVIGAVLVLVVLLAGALLTIAYTTRAWNSSFWGARTPAVETSTVDSAQLAVLALFALVIVAIGAGFEPVYSFADAAAEAAIDSEAYVEAVGPVGGEEP